MIRTEGHISINREKSNDNVDITVGKVNDKRIDLEMRTTSRILVSSHLDLDQAKMLHIELGLLIEEMRVKPTAEQYKSWATEECLALCKDRRDSGRLVWAVKTLIAHLEHLGHDTTGNIGAVVGAVRSL